MPNHSKDNKTMINIQNITYRYPGSKHLVFKDFSLTLEPGRIYGLLGKNGTGKSTLLYLICGLLRLRQGDITVNGERSALRTPGMLQDIYLVPEEYDLPAITLKEYVRISSVFYPASTRTFSTVASPTSNCPPTCI